MTPMTTLPAPALEKLAEARLFAEHADELAELEGHGWRFGLTDAGVFVAEGGRDRSRRFDSDLGSLIQRCMQTPRPRATRKDMT